MENNILLYKCDLSKYGGFTEAMKKFQVCLLDRHSHMVIFGVNMITVCWLDYHIVFMYDFSAIVNHY